MFKNIRYNNPEITLSPLNVGAVFASSTSVDVEDDISSGWVEEEW